MMIILTLFLGLLWSCATVDVEDRVQGASSGSPSGRDPAVRVVPVEIPPGPPLIREKPVYVPAADAPEAAPKPSGREAVAASNQAGIVQPSEYSRAAMVYDYHPDWVYELYTRPLRASDICLQPGEKAVEAPFISDSERWLLGAGVSMQGGVQVQHIYVKPTEASLEASLIINTDRRVYHLILRSFKDVHMPLVRWRYFSTGMPDHYASSPAAAPAASSSGAENPAALIDPRLLSFNYRMIYTLFGKPSWLPELVYDDGKKTYISFPQDVLQKQLPAVFEKRGNIVNYRVAGNLIIIDRLVEELTVKLEETEISIEKKKG